jgi:hypothetical protein
VHVYVAGPAASGCSRAPRQDTSSGWLPHANRSGSVPKDAFRFEVCPQPESRYGRQCHHGLLRWGAAQVSALQLNLPTAGLDLPAAPLPLRGPSRAASTRPIHVSGFERAGNDFYATPSWVTEALLQHIRFRGPIWESPSQNGGKAVAGRSRPEYVS